MARVIGSQVQSLFGELLKRKVLTLSFSLVMRNSIGDCLVDLRVSWLGKGGKV
jgi:hypothetical protein